MAVAGLISILGGGTGALMGLLLALVVGRRLGGADAGYFFQLVALFMIAANVLELGADTGLVRQLSRLVPLHRTADLRRTVVVAVVPVVLLGALAVGLLLYFAGPLANALAGGGDAATIHTLIVHAAPFLLPAALVTVLLGGTRGLGGVVPFTVVYNVGVPVARVAGVGAVLLAGFGLLATVRVWAAPFVLAAVVAAVILLRQLARSTTATDDGVPATPIPVLAREFWSFSAPRGVAAGVEIALAWLDVLIVGALLGPIAAGVYAVAVRCAQSGMLVDTALRMAVSPRISAALATGDVAVARRLYLGGTRSMILLAWPVFVTVALFADVVLPLFGEGFVTGSAALVLLCVAMVVLSGAGMVQSVLLMGGRSHWQLLNKSVALVVNVVADVVLVPVLGLPGAALGWLLTVAVDVGLASRQVRRLLAIRGMLRDLLAPSALVVATVAVPGLILRFALGATPAALGIDVGVSATLLLGSCWCLRGPLGLREVLRGARARVAPTAV